MTPLQTAPFFAKSKGHRSYWIKTRDQKRLRLVTWPQGQRGTILLFNGRTEYCEKFIHVAAEYCRHGYAFLTFDWRGQGLSDRPSDDRTLCHVNDFVDFQLDVEAVQQALDALHLPQPVYLLAHSMGGCIALRALYQNLRVRAVHFASPMWGIKMNKLSHVLVQLFCRTLSRMGFEMSHFSNPISQQQHNRLTSDSDMLKMINQQVTERPDLYVGGPSMGWLDAALRECRNLAAINEPPQCPTLISVGEHEKIVDITAIRRCHRRWPQSELDIVGGALHELMMERPEIRQKFLTRSLNFFLSQGP